MSQTKEHEVPFAYACGDDDCIQFSKQLACLPNSRNVRELFDRPIPRSATSPENTPQWFLIESAPRDGTRVLVWNKHFHAPITAKWYGGSFKIAFEFPDFTYEPTHWMALPLPPPVTLTSDMFKESP